MRMVFWNLIMKKSLLVILDANIIIDAHKNNYWNALINSYQIFIPATVIHDEAIYFNDAKGRKLINLQPLVKNGSVFILEATLEEYQKLQSLVTPSFLQSIDPGEKEAFALMKNPKYKDFYFCTGDGRAIQALSVLQLSSQGISLEKLLHKIGNKRKLDRHFSESWFQKQLATGFQDRDFWILK